MKLKYWWKNLTYWKKGGIIISGLFLSLIIIILFFERFLIILGIIGFFLGSLIAGIFGIGALFYIFTIVIMLGSITGIVLLFPKLLKKQTSLNVKLWIIITMLFLICIIYSFTFVIIRPVDSVITDGHPILTFVCRFQAGCKPSVTDVQCQEYWDDPKLYATMNKVEKKRADRIMNWRGYKGCNESTSGFYRGGSELNPIRYIPIEVCSCTN